MKLPQDLNVTGSKTDMDVDRIIGVACESKHSFIWTQNRRAYGFGNNFYVQLGYDFQKADFKEHQIQLYNVFTLISKSNICTRYMLSM